MVKFAIGIDPGLAGAIAVFRENEFSVFEMPLKANKKIDVERISEIVRFADVVFTEIVIGWPGNDSRAQCTSCMNYGKLLAVFELAQIPYYEIMPRTWQAKMIPGTVKGETKKVSIAVAREKFPGVSLIPSGKRIPKHDFADALNILAYGMDYILKEK